MQTGELASSAMAERSGERAATAAVPRLAHEDGHHRGVGEDARQERKLDLQAVLLQVEDVIADKRRIAGEHERDHPFIHGDLPEGRGEPLAIPGGRSRSADPDARAP